MSDISVIIPTYNRSEFLLKSVESVLNQSFKEFELIIIDDGSDDNTEELIKNLKDKRINYYYQFNRGPAVARNNGIKRSTCKYIAFLDSDDAWTEDKLKVQIKAMKENPGHIISHTEEIWYKGKRLIKPQKIHKKRQGDIFKQSLKLCSISMSTVMIRKELIKKIGLFDPDLEVCEDYDYWLRVTAQYSVLLIDKPLTIKQGGHFDQQSQKYFGLDKFRIYAIEKLIRSKKLTKENPALAVSEMNNKCKIYGQGCLKYNKKEEGEYYIKLGKKYKI